jgi:hypothetical protein
MANTESEEITHLLKLKDPDSFLLWDFEMKILFHAKELMSIIDSSDLLSAQGKDQEKTKKWKIKDA